MLSKPGYALRPPEAGKQQSNGDLLRKLRSAERSTFNPKSHRRSLNRRGRAQQWQRALEIFADGTGGDLQQPRSAFCTRWLTLRAQLQKGLTAWH